MSVVGDSAEEYVLTHALVRERFLVLSCDLPLNALKILFVSRLETMESFCLCIPHASHQKHF